jgi:hypothetical protein
MSEEIVQYGSYSLDSAAEDRAELDASGGSANFMSLKEGKNIVRFLPPLMGQTRPFKTVIQHYIKRAVGNQLVIVCPQQMAKQRCPVCEKIKILAGSRSRADQELAKTYSARRRIFANVIDRSDPEKGPQILGFGKMIQDDLVSIREDPNAGGDFCDPKVGFDIVIERTGSGMQTKYSVSASRSDSELGQMEWIAMQNDLDRFAKVESYESIVDRLNGGDGSAGADADPAPASLPASASEEAPRGRNVQNAIDVEEVSKPEDGVNW